jgi:mRNA interferase RelE/StbE
LAWTIEYADSALKKLKKLDRPIARAILEYMDERVATADDPRSLGKKLVGPRYGIYWRYRVGDTRIICDIKDEKLIILVIEVGHRKDIYRTW